MSVIRLLHGTRSTPVSRLRLGAGIFVNIEADGTHVLTTTPTDFGDQDSGQATIRQAPDTVPIFYGIGGPVTIGPVPAAKTDLDPNFRPWKHIPEGGYVRLCAVVTTPVTGLAAIGLEQSTDNATWGDIPTSALRLRLNQSGPIVTPWLPVAAGASGDRILRAVMIDGDGAESVAGTLCWAEFLPVAASGTAPCVEVWHQNFGDYADTAALLAEWIEDDPNNIGTWTLEPTPEVYAGSPSSVRVPKISVVGTITNGHYSYLRRTVPGFVPGATYQFYRVQYQEDTNPHGPPLEWNDHPAVSVVADASGNLALTIGWLQTGTSGINDFIMFDGVRVERCT